MPLDPRAERLIDELRLEPHVEGGFYREVFRSASLVQLGDGGFRSALTTIYFLLPAGSVSRWHRVTSDEVWHLHEGDGIELLLSPPGLESLSRIRLGPPLTSSGPVFTVEAGWWQAATPVGSYALAGCTVGPGFEFTDFQLIRDDPHAAEKMARLGADVAALI